MKQTVKRMRTYGVAALIALSTIHPALADPAEAIVERMNFNESFMKSITPIMPMMTDQIIAQMRAGGATLIQRLETEGKGGLPAFQKILREEIDAAFRAKLPEMNQRLSELMREKFTAKELKQIEAFAKTDSGEKFFAVLYGSAQDEMQRFGEVVGAQAGMVAVSNAMARSEKEQF